MLWEIHFHSDSNKSSEIIERDTCPSHEEMSNLFKVSVFRMEKFKKEEALTCALCGHTTMSRHSPDADDFCKRQDLCYTCGFWMNKVEMHKMHFNNAIPVLCETSNGMEHYVLKDPVHPLDVKKQGGLGVGHGGRTFTIEITKGDYMGTWVSNNVWSQGQPPASFWLLFENIGRLI